MLGHAAASFCPEFQACAVALPGPMHELLDKAGILRPTVFAQLARHAPGSPDALRGFRQLLEGLGAPPEHLDEWARFCLKLHAIATDAAPEIRARLAQRSGFEISADLIDLRLAGAQKAQAADLNRLALHSLAHLPAEWKGKRYRRTLGHGTEHARAEGERTERLRKGREVLGLLLEARLPFATSVQAAPKDEASLLRCCRGLRSKTLAQRVSCWRPFRRYLVGQGLAPWPTHPDHLLGYFELLAEEGMAPSTLPSLLSALRFLEEAGELAEHEKLSKHPAIRNAVLEHSLKEEDRAAAQRAAGTKKEKTQAPPLLLRLLIELELVVRDEDRPLYHRAFAWYRLFRHWASLRWDDT